MPFSSKTLGSGALAKLALAGLASAALAGCSSDATRLSALSSPYPASTQGSSEVTGSLGSAPTGRVDSAPIGSPYPTAQYQQQPYPQQQPYQAAQQLPPASPPPQGSTPVAYAPASAPVAPAYSAARPVAPAVATAPAPHTLTVPTAAPVAKPAVVAAPVAAPAPAPAKPQAVAAAPATPAPAQKTTAVQSAPMQTAALQPAATATAPAAGKPAAQAAKPAATAAAEEADDAPRNGSGPQFRAPVRGRVISSFGPKPGGTRNDGVNFAVPEGTGVRAAEDGTVAYAGNELKGYGNLVLIKHQDGYVTAYAHNSELMVKRGDTVRRGQIIAKAGQSGGVNSPQLHFEIRKGSQPVDPSQYVAGL